MIGTSDEMLLYFSYTSKEFSVIATDKAVISRIRDDIRRNRLTEEMKSEWLTLLGCKQLRPRVLVPAVIRDRYGRIFDECSFVRYYLSEKEKKTITRLIGSCKSYGGTLTERPMRILLRHKKAEIETPRMELPSVWIYEPVFSAIPNTIKKSLGRMIGNNLSRL